MSDQSATCITRPAVLHVCLSSTLRRLRALGAVPVHNGRQPVADVRVPVVLHMRHVQKGQRCCSLACSMHQRALAWHQPPGYMLTGAGKDTQVLPTYNSLQRAVTNVSGGQAFCGDWNTSC